MVEATSDLWDIDETISIHGNVTCRDSNICTYLYTLKVGHNSQWINTYFPKYNK